MDDRDVRDATRAGDGELDGGAAANALDRERPTKGVPADASTKGVAAEASTNGVSGEARTHGLVGGTGSGRERIAALADEMLPALIARLDASGLGELEVREDGWRVRLRKPADGMSSMRPRLAAGRDPVAGERRGASRAAGVRAGTAGEASALTPVGQGREATDASNAGAAEPGRTRHVVVSPAVGYYTPVDGIGPGHTVGAPDILGHVDVLGVRHDVVAGTDGVVARVLVEPGEAVEYGQELIRIEPRPRAADTGPAGRAPGSL